MWILFVLDGEEDSHCFVVFVCVLRDIKTSAADGDARCPSIGESNSRISWVWSPCLCFAFTNQTPKSSISFLQYCKPYWSFYFGLCAWFHALPCESFASGVESPFPLAGLPYVAKRTHKIYSKGVDYCDCTFCKTFSIDCFTSIDLNTSQQLCPLFNSERRVWELTYGLVSVSSLETLLRVLPAAQGGQLFLSICLRKLLI